MSVTNINGSPIRFQNGGYIMIADSTNVLNILNIAENGGAVHIKPGSREAVSYRDRGVQQVPLEGDDMPGEIELEVKYTSALSSKDLLTFLRTSPGTGLKQVFKFFIGVLDSRSAVAGLEWIFAKCVVDPDTIDITMGDKFDSLKLRLKNHELTADPARFISLRTTSA